MLENEVTTEIKEADLIYAAGFFDGEGCISITCVVNRHGYYNYFLQVSVVNTNKEVIEWFQKTFGGYINIRKIFNIKTHKQTYSYRIGSKRALRFLKLISPYLKVKTVQARLAIEFQEGVETRPGEIPNWNELLRRNNFYLELKELNKRGPVQ